METKNTENIYKIDLNKEENDSPFNHVDFETLTFEECEKMMDECKKGIKYMVDCSSEVAVCCAAKGTSAIDHIHALRMIIESIYLTYIREPDCQKMAKLFRQLMTMSLNDDEFWNDIERECITNRYSNKMQ